ncbi:response regulator transcription factor [bacterium]|jgi:DNA-binding NarL/FixJ family response regulator|nr:response regulator transcription factor [bacterium]
MIDVNLLTPREKLILKLVCQGYSNTEIGKKLFISSHTVKFHIVSILHKFNLKNRIVAAYFAGKNNLF